MSAQVADRPTAELRHPADLEPVANRWQRALDADFVALNAVGGILPATEVASRLFDLAQERQDTELLLARLARSTGALPVPWLAPRPVTNKMLGLPDDVEACIFDLDGVLTDSGLLHAWAWARDVRSVPHANLGKGRVAVHPVRPGRGLPLIRRRAAEARGCPYVPREPGNPPSRGPAGRQGEQRDRLRSRPPQERVARTRDARSRGDTARRRAPISRGRGPRRTRPSSRLGKHQDASDATARRP